jgi:hypothetical protein
MYAHNHLYFETTALINGNEFISYTILLYRRKGKAVPVTGCGGSMLCGTSRLPHFIDNWFTDGGEVVSLTRLPPFTPRNIPDTYIC